MDVFVIRNVVSKKMKLRKKFVSTHGKTNRELIEYIDNVNEQITMFYDIIAKDTRQVLTSTKLNDMQRSYLEWSLVHLHGELLKTHETLKNMQRSLKTHEDC